MTNDTPSLLPTERLEPVPRTLLLCDLPLPSTLWSKPTPAFVRSIEEYGMLYPICVTPDLSEGDRYQGWTVLDGRRRLAALWQLYGDAPQCAVNVLVFPEGTTPEEVMALVTNHQRSDSVVTDINHLANLIARGFTASEIARATGIAVGTVKRLTNLKDRLVGPLWTALSEGRMVPSVAEAAAKLHKMDQVALSVGVQGEPGKRITASMVKEIRSVKAAEATMALPEEMFAPETPRELLPFTISTPAEAQLLSQMETLHGKQDEAKTLLIRAMVRLKALEADVEGANLHKEIEEWLNS